MLNGKLLRLRPVREKDLDALYDAHIDLSNRGSFFPLGVASESAFRKEFAETGFWQKESGTLVMLNMEDEIVGEIEFFKPVNYWDAFELSYRLHDAKFAGRGYTTEAVQLLVEYLFANKKQHRIQLVIVPENSASRRIAEKCGFVLEGTARGAFYNSGRNHDVVIYSILKTDPRRRPGDHA